MLRISSPILLAVILEGPIPSTAGEEPPSSFAPPERGTVTFTHEATRVVACARKADKHKLLACSAQRTATDSSATLSLRPIVAKPVGNKDKREKLQVELPKQAGMPVKLALPVGIWELEWSGRTDRNRFHVEDRDEFSIDLKTQLGSCRRVGADCKIRPGDEKREVKIPKRRQRDLTAD